MSLTNPNKVVTEERLAQFYQAILPYLGTGVEYGAGTSIDIDANNDISIYEMPAADMTEIIDPLPGPASQPEAANPVGCIIQMMGVSAPSGYLICNGATYNIAQYPRLANYFLLQFGVINKFGGDGTTTFAVPDLRGEFLRGTGTNGHAGCGSGSGVGVHQAPTYHQRTCTGWGSTSSAAGGFIVYSDATNDSSTWINNSTNEDSTTTSKRSRTGSFGTITGNTSNAGRFTSRPTNTSVLYCIKY